MPSITFDRWDAGMDRRKSRGVSDANRLWTLKNAYITDGWVPRVRPGLEIIATLEDDGAGRSTVGLIAHDGKLHTFYNSNFTAGAITHANALFQANDTDSGGDLARVHGHGIFAGYIYAAIENVSGTVNHHYFDTSPSVITDVNCPDGKAVVIAASKVFSNGDEVVRFSKTDAPRNWTAVSDAGFLPTGRQAPGSAQCLALGMHNQRLAVFAVDSVQTWNVDPDPAQMSINQVVRNIGTRYLDSVNNVSQDLFFLTDFGFRSINTANLTQEISDADVGGPIDEFVIPYLASQPEAFSVWYQGAYKGNGQYWCFVGNTAFIYTFSRTAKVQAWSYYEYPWTMDAAAVLDGELYLRTGNTVYKVNPDNKLDGLTNIDVDVEMTFQSFKKPGQRKHIVGMDVVCSAAGCRLAARYDAADTAKIGPSVVVDPDTRSGGMIPYELMCTELAPRFTPYSSVLDEPFEINQLTVYYDVLGPM